MSRIRMQIAEAILADVIEELTRIGAFVDDLKMADGVCIVSARTKQSQVAEFERWLTLFTKGAGRVETIGE